MTERSAKHPRQALACPTDRRPSRTMTPYDSLSTHINRRTFLNTTGVGLGSALLASMLGRASADGAVEVENWSGVVNPLHHAPKVKRVIFLCMAGGPSHL